MVYVRPIYIRHILFTPASISRPLSVFQQVGNKSSRWPCRTRSRRLQHRPEPLAGSGRTRTGASGTKDCETLSRTGLVANRSSRTPKCAVGLIRIVISKNAILSSCRHISCMGVAYEQRRFTLIFTLFQLLYRIKNIPVIFI